VNNRKFEPSKKIISLGRSSTGDVVIDDNTLSKYQCSIVYYEEAGWVLMDGSPKDSNNIKGEFNNSTNGSW